MAVVRKNFAASGMIRPSINHSCNCDCDILSRKDGISWHWVRSTNKPLGAPHRCRAPSGSTICLPGSSLEPHADDAPAIVVGEAVRADQVEVRRDLFVTRQLAAIDAQTLAFGIDLDHLYQDVSVGRFDFGQPADAH